MLSLLLLLACDPPAPPPAAPAAPATVPEGAMRNVVVVVIDTLRADAVERARTPTFDRLAATGAQRGWAWSASTWTAPAIISLFTGRHVRHHGWDFPFPRVMAERGQSYPAVPDVPVLAEVLRDAGFHTTGLYANGLLGQELGYGRGFQRWIHGPDPRITARAVGGISSWDPTQRYFLYLHLFGPHHPLHPSEAGRARWQVPDQALEADGGLSLPSKRAAGPLDEEVYWRAYHAVVEDTDARLGEVLDALRPHLDQTLLVVTSDHGELLGEQGRYGHDLGVWEPLTRVPLVVQNGPLLPDRITTAAVPDLVTRAVGVAHDWPVRLAESEALVAQREGAVALTVDGRAKATWDERAYPQPVAFDLVADPGEEHPSSPVPEALVQARARFEAQVPATGLEAAEGAMGAELVGALQALGYMDGSP